MALADDIRVLRDRTLAELIRAHDYYTDTQIAWRIVQETIDAGYKLTKRSTTTGSVTTETTLVDKALGYESEQLAEATLQQFVAHPLEQVPQPVAAAAAAPVRVALGMFDQFCVASAAMIFCRAKVIVPPLGPTERTDHYSR